MHNYSKPIKDGKLVRLSVSQLQLWQDCPAKWHYKYVGGIPDPVRVSAQEGIDGHKRLEMHVRNERVELKDIDIPVLKYIPAQALTEDQLTHLSLADIPFQGSMDLVSGNHVYDYKYQGKIHKFDGPTPQTWGYLEEIRRRRADNGGRYSFHFLLIDKKKPNVVEQVFTYGSAEVEENWKGFAPQVEEMKLAVTKSVEDLAHHEHSCYKYGPCPYLGICSRGVKPEDTMSFLDKLNEAKREMAKVSLPDVDADEPTELEKEKALEDMHKSIRPPEIHANPDPSDYERPPKAKPAKLKLLTVSVRHQVTLDIKRDGVFSASIGLEMSAEAGTDPDETRKLLSSKILDAIKNEAERYKGAK